MSLSDDQVKSLVLMCLDQAKPISYISRVMGVDRRVIYDWMRSKEGRHLFMTKKEIDGLVYCRPKETALYLLSPEANLKPTIKTTSGDENNPNSSRFNTGGKIGPERKEAIQLVKQEIDIYPIKEVCLDKFETYMDRVNNSALMLIPNPEEDFYGPPILLRYSTRFTDPKKKAIIRKRYFDAWEGAANRYKFGVFMTLTTDPKQFDNLWEANKQFQVNWNKLITYLRKMTGRDLEYICVREFQKNGRLHFHVAIFGIKYLIHTKQLSAIWNKYGQGKIVHIYGMRKDHDNEWVWARASPDDAQGRQPKDYVKKYILKAQYDDNVTYQYWIYNSRFYTYSPTLCKFVSYYISKHLYIFARTVNLEDEAVIMYDAGDIIAMIEPEGDPPPDIDALPDRSSQAPRDSQGEIMTTERMIELFDKILKK